MHKKSEKKMVLDTKAPIHRNMLISIASSTSFEPCLNSLDLHWDLPFIRVSFASTSRVVSVASRETAATFSGNQERHLLLLSP
ncbi:unnamed protein product [Bursaphelenchus okinawaensis]|uniref:Uncharacterized protein n=1 Tax=Bursaphelenchus okinawaensis TaxID=465554 RepID=A0A811LRK0_9BILA|nr:unnamed protein product [Bursaphelenchus okinawaensis]CAG9128233.1 unnamed protein product [Bursaphelenchus okinawaensis]